MKINKVLPVIATIMMIIALTSLAITSYANDVNEQNNQYFSDVSNYEWSYEVLNYLASNDIIGGFADGTFKPMDNLTRAQFAKILVNIANIPVYDETTMSYSDILTDNTLLKYVEAAKPYMTSYRNTNTNELFFFPEDVIARIDLIVTSLRMLGVDVNSVDVTEFNNKFVDAYLISDEKKQYAAYAAYHNIVNGFDDNTFRSEDPVTRADACVILYRMFSKIQTVDYVETNFVHEFEQIEVIPANYSQDDLNILAKLMYCEAGSYWITDEQQMLFGCVVLNRVASPYFPNTVREVAYQKGQYIPSAFENKLPDSRTYENAKRLLEGYRPLPENVLFQANFKQGSGVYLAINFDHLGTTYFCYI